VQAAMQYYREEPANLIVMHDEVELPFGELKIKFGGGHKGNNGVRSIIQHVGSADFHRVRIGVGRPDHPEKTVADHVLGDFSAEEMRLINEMSPRIMEALREIISA
jgi:PTH1 family peptidyl-tRNA hydrolase